MNSTQASSIVAVVPRMAVRTNRSLIWQWFLFALLLILIAPRLSVASMPTFESLPAINTGLWLPTAVAVGPDEKVYIAEPDRNRVSVYSGAGQPLSTKSGFDAPVAIAVDLDGKLYVGNAGRGNVEVYGADLVLLGKLGAGDNEFLRPSGIAVDSEGVIYVTDSRAHMVKVFNSDRSSKSSFGSPGTGNGQFRLPTSIAVMDNGLTGSAKTGELYIPDLSVTKVGGYWSGYYVARVQVFNLTGSYLRSFHSVGKDDAGKAYDFMRPLGIAVDTLDRIYLTDAYQSVVTVYSNTGSYLGNINDENHPLRNPLGIAFAPNSSRLFVASLNTATIETFGLDRNYGDIEVSPTSNDFGAVLVGDSSSPASFGVSNAGSGDLTIGSIALAGANADEFVIQSDDCSGQTLGAMAGCSIDVLFSPTSGGSDKSATLSIPSDDLYEPTVSVALSGDGDQVLHDLTVAKIGTGSGTVLGTGVSCGTDCTEAYAEGSVVTLTAESSIDSLFNGWTGGSCSGTAGCIVTMNQSRLVTAEFKLNSTPVVTYEIFSSAGDNGIIDPEGAISVVGGGAKTFNIEADQDYRIVDVLVNGVSQGVVDTYRFEDVATNHTISVEFASNSFLLSSVAIGEVSVDHKWKRVVLDRAFDDPVVVVKPASLNDTDPAVVRVRNVTSQGFEVRIQEWEYLDGNHAEEQISYIVMENGSHALLDNGTRIEAGRFDTDRTSCFGAVAFTQTFAVTPVVMASVVSFNEADAVVGRIKGVSPTGFQHMLQEQAGNTLDHAMETVSFIAWEPSMGRSDGISFEINRGVDAQTQEFKDISFLSGYMEAPQFIADLQTTDSSDAANLRWTAKDAYGVSVLIDQEDSPMASPHTSSSSEVIGYLLLTGQANMEVDTDSDGLPDEDEYNIYGTDPLVADTDGDGLRDGDEVIFWGSDWGADPDADGWINLLDEDSDNDGYPDSVFVSINGIAAATSSVDGSFDRSGAAFDRSGAKFDRSGAAFDRSGAKFDRSGAAFDRSGAKFDRSGGAFDRSGAKFDRSGGAFDRSGAAFDRSGAKFDRSGVNKENTSERAPSASGSATTPVSVGCAL